MGFCGAVWSHEIRWNVNCCAVRSHSIPWNFNLQCYTKSGCTYSPTSSELLRAVCSHSIQHNFCSVFGRRWARWNFAVLYVATEFDGTLRCYRSDRTNSMQVLLRCTWSPNVVEFCGAVRSHPIWWNFAVLYVVTELDRWNFAVLDVVTEFDGIFAVACVRIHWIRWNFEMLYVRTHRIQYGIFPALYVQ